MPFNDGWLGDEAFAWVSMDRHSTLTDFLTALAAKQPTPGGGAVAALAGALAGAMGEMVFAYSIGKKDLSEYQTDIASSMAELQRARSLLLGLMEEDQQAYAALTEARRLPPDAADRKDRLAAATLASLRVPQAVSAVALRILEVCSRSVSKVNKYLLSDLAVSMELAMATLRAAGYNVRVNLPEVDDLTERQGLLREQQELVARGVELIRLSLPEIWRRLESNG